jgi:hypothetical protein
MSKALQDCLGAEPCGLPVLSTARLSLWGLPAFLSARTSKNLMQKEDVNSIHKPPALPVAYEWSEPRKSLKSLTTILVIGNLFAKMRVAVFAFKGLV